MLAELCIMELYQFKNKLYSASSHHDSGLETNNLLNI